MLGERGVQQPFNVLGGHAVLSCGSQGGSRSNLTRELPKYVLTG
jgi:hypothetical protein